MKSNTIIDKNMKRILLIGANGFLGSYLMELGNKSDITLIASDIENSHLNSNAPFYRIDITDAKYTFTLALLNCLN